MGGNGAAGKPSALQSVEFIVTTEGPDRLGLRDLCQRFADERWTAGHMTPEQAAESVLDEFKRAVRQELELLQVEGVEG